MKEKPKIIISNMFPNASYLVDNLGHECINLFRADDSKYYLWLNADGTYDKKYGVPEYVLLVTKTGKTGLYQIIAKAAVIGIFGKANETGKRKASLRFSSQKNIIKYGHKKIENIYKENGDGENTIATFVCDSIRPPLSECYLVFKTFKNCEAAAKKPNFCLIESKTQFSETLRFTDLSPKDLNKIESIILNEKLWGKKLPKFNLKQQLRLIDNYQNFLFLAGIEEQELVYSNLIVNLLKKFNCINDFVSHVFYNKKRLRFSDFRLHREKNNIDMFFVGGRTDPIVIVENKINSDITDTESKLSKAKHIKNVFNFFWKTNLTYTARYSEFDKKKFYRRVKRIVCLDNGKKPSQLSKYYIIGICYALIVNQWNDNQAISKVNCYFLIPTWAKEQYTTNKKNFLIDQSRFLSSKFKVVTYDKIYNFFDYLLKNKLYKTFSDKFLLEDFKKALYQLKSPRNNAVELQQKRLFIDRFEKVSE